MKRVLASVRLPSFARERSGAPVPSADGADVHSLFERARDAVSRLPRHVLRPGRAVRVHERGIHGRRRAGSGDSFWQFRHYHSGEPAHRIDWRRSARSDHLYVRQREWETSRILWIACDLSGSMRYRSHSDIETKRDAAVTLAFAAALLGWRTGELVALAGADGRPFGAMARHRLVAAMQGLIGTEDGREWPDGLATGRLPAHGRAVIVSDFLVSLAALERLVRRLVERRIAVLLVRIEDPAERAFSFTGRLRLEGLEGEAPLLLEDAGAAHDEIAGRLAAHARALEGLAADHGARLVVSGTDRPLADRVLSLAGLLAR